MNFKQYTTLLCGSMLLMGASTAMAAAPFFVITDTPALTMSTGDDFLEVDFTITNNYSALGPNDELTVSHLPKGVYPVFDFEDESDAYCEVIGGDELEGAFKIEPLEDIGDSCLLRLFVDHNGDADDAVFDKNNQLTINPKVCANDMVCSDAAANHSKMLVTLADLGDAPVGPHNIALIENSQIEFTAELEGFSTPCADSTFDCYAMEIIIPTVYETLVTVRALKTPCALDNDGDLACKILIQVNDETLFKQIHEDEDVRSPAVAKVNLINHSLPAPGIITSDTTIKLWWDAVELRKGDQQHLQYQSLEVEQDDDYPGVVHLEDVFFPENKSLNPSSAEAGLIPVEFCDYDDPTCRYRTTCEFEEGIGDDACKVWFVALEPNNSSTPEFGSAPFTIEVDLGETYAFDEFEIFYSKTFTANYSLDLYAGVADTNLFTGQFITSVVKFDGTSWTELDFFGPEGPVFALANWEGDLVAGGQFGCSFGPCKQDDFQANNVARWNGGRWHTLGEGFSNGTDGPVYALADGNETLYVGGQFDTAGFGTTVSNITGWNGDDWDDLGGGVDCSIVNCTTTAAVRALQFVSSAQSLGCGKSGSSLDDTLYVGGTFDTVSLGFSSFEADNIALFDTDARFWNSLGDPSGDQGTNDTVRALAWNNTVSDCILYVGGDFTATFNTSAVSMNYVGAWDAFNVDWFPLDDSSTGQGTNGPVHSLLWDNHFNTLVVGGAFNAVGFSGNNTPVNNVAQWDPTIPDWFDLDADDTATGPLGTVYALEQLNQFVYLGGQFTQVADDGGLLSATNVTRFTSGVKDPDYSALSTGVPDGPVSSLLVMPGLEIDENN